MSTRSLTTWMLLVVVALTFVAPANAGLLFKRAAVETAAPLINVPPVPDDLPPSPVVLVPSGPKVPVSYRHIGRPIASKCSPVSTRVLYICDPCTGCKIEVPVCLPCCCDDCPKVSSRRAVFSVGLVTYEWCCGVKVVVRLQRCGEVLVTYHRA